MSLLSDDDWAEVEADGIAAEYALGLLTAQEAAAAEMVMELDPETARAVAAWTATFSALSKAGLPRTPPAELRARICAPVTMPDFSQRPGGRVRQWIWRLAHGTRGASFVAAVAAVLALAALAGWLAFGRLSPDYETVIPGTASVPGLWVHLDTASRELTVMPSGAHLSLIPPFGRTYAIWAEHPQAPVYIGTLDPLGQLAAPWPSSVSAAGAALVVTLEPRAPRAPQAPSRSVVARSSLNRVP